MNELDKKIRKLRKKLRQIDQLTVLTRELNDEETQKIASLPVIRNELQRLLKEKQSSRDLSDGENTQEETFLGSGDQLAANFKTTEDTELHFQDVMEETDDEEEGEEREQEKREKELESEGNRSKPTASISKRKTEESKSGDNFTSAEPEPEQKKKKLEQELEEQRKQQQQSKQQEQKLQKQEQPQKKQKQPQRKQEQPQKKQEQSQKKQEQSQRPWWRDRPRYFVQELVSHLDIILDISIADGLVASASRDSQVKIWSLDSGALECTLSGHSEAAQACLLLPAAASEALARPLSIPPSSRLVVTGGGDSHLLLWRIDPGLRMATELRRIYTFTPITGLVRLEDEEGLVVAVGTSSGKIEVWNLLEKRLERSCQLHRSPVTCVRLTAASAGSPVLLLSCSEAGEAALLRPKNLATVYIAGEASSRRGVRHNAALALGTERLLVADSGASLKLHRRGFRGLLRVSNSRHEFGMSDALWSGDAKLVLASAFDVDNGRSYLNCHNFEDPSRPAYLVSLEPPQCAGRVLCLDAVLSEESGAQPDVIVTGGVELLLWQRLSANSDFSEAECSRARIYRLFRPADDQEYSDASGLSSDDASGLEDEGEDEEGEVEAAQRSWWWCNVL